VLIQQTPNVQSARQVRFTSVAQVTLKAFVKQALALAAISHGGARALLKRGRVGPELARTGMRGVVSPPSRLVFRIDGMTRRSSSQNSRRPLFERMLELEP